MSVRKTNTTPKHQSEKVPLLHNPPLFNGIAQMNIHQTHKNIEDIIYHVLGLRESNFFVIFCMKKVLVLAN